MSIWKKILIAELMAAVGILLMLVANLIETKQHLNSIHEQFTQIEVEWLEVIEGTEILVEKLEKIHND